MRTTVCRSLIGIIAIAICCFASAQENDLAQRISQLNRQIEVSRPSRGANPLWLQQQVQTAIANRQQLVEELIRTQPAAVRAVRLSPQVASTLPSNLATLVESDQRLVGRLEQTIADDFVNQRSVTQWNLHTLDQRVEVVFPEGSHPEQMLGRTIQISGVGTINVVAVENARALSSTGARLEAPAQSSAITACSTLGTQNVAVIMLNQGAGGATFPSGITASYLQNEYFSATPKSVPTYWNETSFNQTTASGQVFGPFNLDRVYTCSETNAIASKAITLAQAGGVDFSSFSRVSFVFPTNSCNFSGLGDVGCRSADNQITHPYTITWIPILPSYTGATEIWGTLVHELGHNLGLSHGNSLDFGAIPLGAVDYNSVQPGGGTASNNVGINTEYGDRFTVMGQTQCGGQYSAFAKT